jgi:hypothetical protein
MGKSRKVPKDLMGTILRESAGSPGGERDSPESVEPGVASPAAGGEGTISWEDQPWLVGTTFNLSKQVVRELDRLRHDLQREENIHTSNSEIAEVALRISIEDARKRGRGSELVSRLVGELGSRTKYRAGEAGVARRSVDGSGHILRPACGDGIRGRAGEAPEPGE